MSRKLDLAVSPARRRAWWFRVTGVSVLVLGLVGAGVIYWLGTRAADFSDDPSMLGYNKAENRQMGMMYGKQGELMEDMLNGLKQPGTQAMILGTTAFIIAGICFYFARLSDLDEEVV